MRSFFTFKFAMLRGWLICAAVLISIPCQAERLAVSVPKANVRSGPGAQHDVLWEVEQYHPLDITKKNGEWYQFTDYEGDSAWINAKLLKPVRTVITNKDNCNIRSGPSSKDDIVFTAEKGIPFKVLQEKDSWIQIEHADGDKGWIHKSLIW